MNWIALATTRFEVFILVFARVLSILSTIPFFGTRQIPGRAKIAFSYFIVLILFPVIPLPKSLPDSSLLYFLMISREVILGLIIGYVSSILLTAVQIGGQIVDLQMGFGIVNVLNPISNIQQSIMAQFQYLIAVLLFVVMDGHHLLLLALSESFRILPLGQLHFSTLAFTTLNGFLSRMFVIAIQLAFPSMAALFITNFALGFLSRLVPQMNVFFVGFPLTLLVGFLVISVTLGTLIYAYNYIFHEIINEILTMFKVLR